MSAEIAKTMPTATVVGHTMESLVGLEWISVSCCLKSHEQRMREQLPPLLPLLSAPLLFLSTVRMLKGGNAFHSPVRKNLPRGARGSMVHPAWLLTFVLSHACSVLSLRTGSNENSQKNVPRCIFPNTIVRKDLSSFLPGNRMAEPPVYVQVHPGLRARRQQQASNTHGMQRREQELPAGRVSNRLLLLLRYSHLPG